MTAAAVLREAHAACVELRLVGGTTKVRGKPDPALLARLREHKAAIAAILRGDACRWCGEPMHWPAPVGVVEGTGTALHLLCYRASEIARVTETFAGATPCS